MKRYIIISIVYLIPFLFNLQLHAQEYVIKALILDPSQKGKPSTMKIDKKPITADSITISMNAIIEWGNIRQMNVVNTNDKNDELVLTRKVFEDKGIRTIAQYKSPRKRTSKKETGARRGDNVDSLRPTANSLLESVRDNAIKDSISLVLTSIMGMSDSDSVVIKGLLQGVIEMAEESLVEFDIDSTSHIINKEKRLALIIGNNDYGASIGLSRLITPGYDAEDISRLLKDSLGFDVITVHNRDSACIIEHIDRFVEKMNKNDYRTGLFYYAGHGGSTNNVDYIIPIDRKRKRFISYQEIVKRLQTSGKRMLVFFDACRSVIDNDRKETQKDSYGKDDWTMIMTSVGSGEPAFDGLGNSPFAKELMTNIIQEDTKVVEVLQSVKSNLQGKPGLFAWIPSKERYKDIGHYKLRPVIKRHSYFGISPSWNSSSVWGIDLDGGIQWNCGLMMEGGIQLYGGESEKLYTSETDSLYTPTDTYFGRRFGLFIRGGYNISHWFIKKGSEISMTLYGEGSFVYVNNYSWGFYCSPNFRLGYNINKHLQVHGDFGYEFNAPLNKKFEALPKDASYKEKGIRIQLGVNYIF